MACWGVRAFCGAGFVGTNIAQRLHSNDSAFVILGRKQWDLFFAASRLRRE